MANPSRKAQLCSGGKGAVELVDDAGVVLATIAIPAGKVPAAEYLDMLPEGGQLRAKGDVSIFEPPSRVHIVPPVGQFDSGANPDWRPTSATRQEKEMRVMMTRMHQQMNRLDQRERALSQVERIPRAAPEPEPEVVEEIPRKPEAKAEQEAAE